MHTADRNRTPRRLVACGLTALPILFKSTAAVVCPWLNEIMIVIVVAYLRNFKGSGDEALV